MIASARPSLRLSVVSALTLLLCAPLACSATTETRPFTVRDSVEWATIEDVSNDPYTPLPALSSPDGKYLVVRTTQADLERNVVRDQLLLYRSDDVERHMESSGSSPLPRILVDNATPTYDGQISDLIWTGPRKLAFAMTRSGSATKQVFIASVEDGALTQVTHHETDVLSFGIGGDTIVYSAKVQSPRRTQRIADDGYLIFLLTPQEAEDPTWAAMDLFVMSRSVGVPRRVAVPTVAMNVSAFRNIWVSPSGNHAVTYTPAINAPEYWADYEVPYPQFLRYSPDKRTSDPQSFDLQSRTRLQLVDTRLGHARALLDAPSGFLAGNRSPRVVFWPKGETKVIVSNTFLPLLVRDPASRHQRTLGPAIAEVDLATGEAEAIAWEPRRTPDVVNGSRKLEPLRAITWNDQTQSLTTMRNSNGIVEAHSYNRKQNAWRRSVGTTAVERLSFRMKEELNARPELWVRSAGCRCERVLIDPNSQAAGLRFGRAEVVRWVDASGLEWQGGLILPPDHRVGTKYPVVLQTHGFRTDEFLIGGPYGGTTAFSAQALASAGFVVLQVEDNRKIVMDRDEGDRYAEGYRSAVAMLVDKGLADPARVGAVFFSRTGLGGIRVLSKYPSLFRAAVFSDATIGGYIGQMSLAARSPQLRAVMAAQHGMLGDVSSSGIADWMKQNPAYKLPNTSTAIRLEALAPSSALDMWEVYALLRRSNRIADLVYIPNATHRLFAAVQRQISQEGTVDWFRFWLQDTDDGDSRKIDQYERWHRLRDEASSTDLTPQGAP